MELTWISHGATAQIPDNVVKTKTAMVYFNFQTVHCSWSVMAWAVTLVAHRRLRLRYGPSRCHRKGRESDPNGACKAIRKANRTIYETGRKSHRLQGMGTTVVAAAVHDGVAHVAHVGDSRFYWCVKVKLRPDPRPHNGKYVCGP